MASAAWVICLPKALNFGLSAVVIAHVFFNTPWIALWVLRARDDIAQGQLEAAATLGATRWQRFRELVFPAICPALATGFAQVFSVCVMSFILVMTLGGGPPVETLETILFSKIRAGGLDLPSAGACAVWQLLMTLAPWILFRGTYSGNLGGSKERVSPIRWFLGLVLTVALLLPYCSLFFQGQLHRLWELRVEVLSSGETSFQLAVATSVLAVTIAALGVWAEQRSQFFEKLGSAALLFPSGISVMVLGLGFFMAYGKHLDPFSGSIWPVAILQAIFFVPVAFRIFQPVAKRRNRIAWDAAVVLGAQPLSAFRWVEWPRWRGPFFGACALVAGAALGEVAAVSLFYNENRVPLALLISRWMGQYRFEEAQGVALLLVTGAAFLIVSGSWAGYSDSQVRHE